jgi:hypothetical protein
MGGSGTANFLPVFSASATLSSSVIQQAFSAQGDKFRNYGIAWRDRWSSVMELFMAGGNYPVAGVSFPSGFPVAVRAEIEAAR